MASVGAGWLSIDQRHLHPSAHLPESTEVLQIESPVPLWLRSVVAGNSMSHRTVPVVVSAAEHCIPCSVRTEPVGAAHVGHDVAVSPVTGEDGMRPLRNPFGRANFRPAMLHRFGRVEGHCRTKIQCSQTPHMWGEGFHGLVVGSGYPQRWDEERAAGAAGNDLSGQLAVDASHVALCQHPSDGWKSHTSSDYGCRHPSPRVGLRSPPRDGSKNEGQVRRAGGEMRTGLDSGFHYPVQEAGAKLPPSQMMRKGV